MFLLVKAMNVQDGRMELIGSRYGSVYAIGGGGG